MLSFPKPWLTLTLDFPNRDSSILSLMDRLDSILRDYGGRLYLAKDARMSPEMFKQSYPRYLEFEKWMDPKLSSSLWRRLR